MVNISRVIARAQILEAIRQALRRCPIAVRTGPRQSGKTTLAREFVDEFLAEIVDGLSEDRKVMLSGFGAFTIARKPDRPGRNPRTGEHHAISARSIVRFKASRMLKARTAGSSSEANDAPAPKPRRRDRSREAGLSRPEATAAG